MLEKLLSDSKTNLETVLVKLKEELNKIHTGRASTEILEDIKVSYYGVPTPLKQVASLTTPQGNIIVIQPWDKGMMGPIESAIREADLGFSPTNDGQVVRIVLSQMTSEDRDRFVKIIHEKAEAGRIAIRNIRKDLREKGQSLEKSSSVSEDEKKRFEEKLDKSIEDYNKRIDEIRLVKEKEITNL